MSAAAVPVFVNPRAGLRRTDTAHLARELGGVGVRLISVEAGGLAGALRPEVAAGTPIVGVAGGDGTLNAAAAALVGTATALLPVPTGTLNHFSQRCGIRTVADAAAALHRPDIARLPVGRYDGGVFLNTLTLGEYARTVRIRERLRRYMGKWPAALVGFAVTTTTVRHVDVTIDAEGRTLMRRTAFLWIGIGWGSFPRVHEALERRREPDLEVAVTRVDSAGAGVRLLARVGWQMLRGHQPVRDPDMDVLHARQLQVLARRRLDGTVDGELVRLESTLRVAVDDAALRVVRAVSAPAPAPSPDGADHNGS